jgi:hypothetical protein
MAVSKEQRIRNNTRQSQHARHLAEPLRCDELVDLHQLREATALNQRQQLHAGKTTGQFT